MSRIGTSRRYERITHSAYHGSLSRAGLGQCLVWVSARAHGGEAVAALGTAPLTNFHPLFRKRPPSPTVIPFLSTFQLLAVLHRLPSVSVVAPWTEWQSGGTWGVDWGVDLFAAVRPLGAHRPSLCSCTPFAVSTAITAIFAWRAAHLCTAWRVRPAPAALVHALAAVAAARAALAAPALACRHCPDAACSDDRDPIRPGRTRPWGNLPRPDWAVVTAMLEAGAPAHVDIALLGIDGPEIEVLRHRSQPVDGLRALVHGHFVVDEVEHLANRWNVDTGASFPGRDRLTLLHVNARRIPRPHVRRERGVLSLRGTMGATSARGWLIAEAPSSASVVG